MLFTSRLKCAYNVYNEIRDYENRITKGGGKISLKTEVQALVRTYIDSRGIKRNHISRVTGIDKRALSDILCCKRELRADEFMKICAALDVEPNKFDIAHKTE